MFPSFHDLLPSELTMMIMWIAANNNNIIELHFKYSNKCVYKHKLRIISRHFTEGNTHCIYRQQAGQVQKTVSFHRTPRNKLNIVHKMLKSAS
jgi:hypothetical protein